MGDVTDLGTERARRRPISTSDDALRLADQHLAAILVKIQSQLFATPEDITQDLYAAHQLLDYTRHLLTDRQESAR